MKPKEQNYSRSRRLKNQVKAVVTNPYNVIVLIAIVLLTYLIVLPLLDMISTSFTLAQKDARLAGGQAGDFTLYYWHRLLASELTGQMLVEPLLNSLLIGFCVSFFAILIGSRKSYATIGGKGGRSTLIRLGAQKPLITVILFVFFIVGIIMPIALLILESFMLREGSYSLSNFTLHYWIGDPVPTIMEGLPGIFKNDDFINSLINSLKLTFVNGIFGTIFGQIIGYICAKGRGKLHGKIVEQLVFIPYLIPSIAFGGIFLSMFSKPQTLFGVTLIPLLYGTFALLTLVSVVKHLPFASRAGTSNMLQIGGELEEAAEIAGAGFFKRFVRIVFPLSKGGFISGFMLIFVSIMKELDLIILLMTPTTATLPYLAFQYQNSNSAQASDCVAIVMFSIVFLVYAIANIFGDADLAKSMGG